MGIGENAMYVSMCRVTLRIPLSASLKDKRQVVRSLLAKLRNEFAVSAAEVDRQDMWQIAVLGLAYVSGERGHAQEVLDHAVRYIEESRPDVEITDVVMDTATMEE
ncbi:MAG: YlxP-like protein [Ktedonobacterales bacterium]|nr:MAG: YlxP-like protein [Ktedonobacterales bacterium]